MKKSKIFAALALSACMALGATGLIACAPNNGGNNGNGDSGYTQDTVDPIMEVYKAYVTSAKANGEEPMSYEEWYADLLANAKGDKGDKGDTGAKGDKGDKGEKGNGWLVGTTEPTAEEGNDGDLYLDYTTWNVYHKESGEWVLLGNIKAEGGNGGAADNGALGTYELKANEPQEVPISVEAGNYTLSVTIESGNEAVKDGLLAKVGDSTVSYKLFEATNNEYTGVLIINDGDDKITFTSTEDITVSFALTAWQSPVLKADGEIHVVPQISVGYPANTSRCLPISIDPSMCGKTYKITIYNESSTVSFIYKSDNSEQLVRFLKKTDPITGEITFDNNPAICFKSNFQSYDLNIAVKIEEVEA